MPEKGVPLKPYNEILRYEQIRDIVSSAVTIGINKVRLTGGEPLIKRDIDQLVRMIADIEGINHIGMTTNGVLLTEKAHLLKDAGLDSLNISLDTLDTNRYKQITRVGDIHKTLSGIDTAIEIGFPIKINMVVFDDTTIQDIKRMSDFCKKKDLKLQLIKRYDLNITKKDDSKFQRPPLCSECNRLRLLSDGTLKPCLHSNDELKINFKDIRGSLISAINSKPASGKSCTTRNMSQIGG
jgi:cyclic pyranopterin phosphate synthase